MTSIDLTAPLIVGFGITGQAVARALIERGVTPIVVDDRPTGAARDAAASLGVRFIEAPDSEVLLDTLASSTVLLPSPGIPDHHPVFSAAKRCDVPVHSEFDLASLWDSRPIVAITGTNGKTSVTMMVADALERSGIGAEAVGNTPTPLVAALADESVQTFVVEASSFRLAHSDRFKPSVATWLNFSPDHLDAHATLADYEAAKASIWSNLGPDAVAVANAEDQVVMSHVPTDRTVVTFGVDQGEWRIWGEHLVGPAGPLMRVEAIARRQPHDLSNATAVAATAIAAGATLASVSDTLADFSGLPHRMSFVGEFDGARWYNDSKATVPQATLAAVGGFPSAVLIAGGRNKGVDLSVLGAAVPPVHTIILIGDATEELASVFASSGATLVRASTMSEAVDRAAKAARQGDAVLLSPACTSFDWYDNYGERGDDFTASVLRRFRT